MSSLTDEILKGISFKGYYEAGDIFKIPGIVGKLIAEDYQGLRGRIVLGDLHNNDVQLNLFEYINIGTNQIQFFYENDPALSSDWKRAEII
jgi:hypothetical protein